MDRDPMLPLGLATLLLAGCGRESDFAAVHPGETSGNPSEVALVRQIIELHDDIAALQRRTDSTPLMDTARQ